MINTRWRRLFIPVLYRGEVPPLHRRPPCRARQSAQHPDLTCFVQPLSMSWGRDEIIPSGLRPGTSPSSEGDRPVHHESGRGPKRLLGWMKSLSSYSLWCSRAEAATSVESLRRSCRPTKGRKAWWCKMARRVFQAGAGANVWMYLDDKKNREIFTYVCLLIMFSHSAT